ncbi:MAG: calcium-translocating P-type ATPase, SERCA-type [archaeon]
MHYYKETLDEIYKHLKSSEKGLSSDEARKRLEQYGFNRIESKKKISPIILFLAQFNNPVVMVLVGAALISAILGELIDFYVIAGILIINAIIGFLQEYKAEKSIDALKKMISLKAVAIRDGEEIEVNAEELVPGDIIILSPGEKVPADSRLIFVNNLQAQEAALTGESLPVKKEITAFSKDLQIGDMKNMVFSGTILTDGKGKAIVVKTGMQSEIGNIAKLIDTAETGTTPLQKKLEKLTHYLTYITLFICIIVFGVLIMKGDALLEALITSVSLAVAAIPEGLPAVVTISLALGVQRMVKRNALVRKLPSVETLGSTTVICSDKTGTLTKNEMTVQKIYVDNEEIDVTGIGYLPEGNFSKKTKDLEFLLKIGVLNNDARLEFSDSVHKIRGDPTEGALIVSAQKHGLIHKEHREKYPRQHELIFDSVRKRMTTIHNINGKKMSFVKGAPDIVLDLCERILIDGKIKPISANDKKKIIEANEKFSSNALRVLGFAYKELTADADYEKNLVFVGLQAMIDPPREEAKDAIKRCKYAGIKVIMITGDHKGTAVAIAKSLGIEGKAVTGEDLQHLNLIKEVENIGVYARVNPEHKMKIVDALKKRGHIVAMTGDGVNDAPAIKSADIGISMSITGSDVAKEASDMILTDDNFASIVNAVEEGRGIFDNIKKFVLYLLSCNVAEILVIFIATLMGMPLPLFAVQILWMNLVTDGLPAVALGVDPISKEVMNRKPRPPKEGILTKSFGIRVIYTGIFITLATLFVFWYALNVRQISEDEARTLTFSTLVLLQFVPLYLIRSDSKLGLWSNKNLILAVLSSVLLQLAVVYTDLGKFFKTVPLPPLDWVFIIGMWILVLLASIAANKIFNKLGFETY